MLRLTVLLSVAVAFANGVPLNCEMAPDGFQRPSTMAHRGLPGYRLEHDIPGYLDAIESGAHYIEYDVTMTKDDELIIVHDTYLDSEYNSAKVFPTLRKSLFLLPALDGDPIKFENKVWQHDLTYSDMVESSLCKSHHKFKSSYPGRGSELSSDPKKCSKPLRVVNATAILEKLRKEREDDVITFDLFTLLILGAFCFFFLLP